MTARGRNLSGTELWRVKNYFDLTTQAFRFKRFSWASAKTGVEKSWQKANTTPSTSQKTQPLWRDNITKYKLDLLIPEAECIHSACNGKNVHVLKSDVLFPLLSMPGCGSPLLISWMRSSHWECDTLKLTGSSGIQKRSQLRILTTPNLNKSTVAPEIKWWDKNFESHFMSEGRGPVELFRVTQKTGRQTIHKTDYL